MTLHIEAHSQSIPASKCRCLARMLERGPQDAFAAVIMFVPVRPSGCTCILQMLTCLCFALAEGGQGHSKEFVLCCCCSFEGKSTFPSAVAYLYTESLKAGFEVLEIGGTRKIHPVSA